MGKTRMAKFPAQWNFYSPQKADKNTDCWTTDVSSWKALHFGPHITWCCTQDLGTFEYMAKTPRELKFQSKQLLWKRMGEWGKASARTKHIFLLGFSRDNHPAVRVSEVLLYSSSETENVTYSKQYMSSQSNLIKSFAIECTQQWWAMSFDQVKGQGQEHQFGPIAITHLFFATMTHVPSYVAEWQSPLVP